MKFIVIRRVEANSIEDASMELGGIEIVRQVDIPASIFPVAYKDWPLWAKAIRQFSTDEDEGIGDVVARIIGDENSESFKAWHLKTFGKPCNCVGRCNRWNKSYPLK